MASHNLKKKLDEAEGLRKVPRGIMKLFKSVDYIGSGEIFHEIAMEETDELKKKEYLLEAAKTFRMEKNEYGFYRAYEIYKLLADLFAKSEPADEKEKEEKEKETLVYLRLAAEQLKCCNKNLMAGQMFMRVAEIQKGFSIKEAIASLKEAVSLFELERDCKYHRKDALETLLLYQLQSQDLRGAFDTLKYLDIKYGQLCRHMLGLILNEPLDEELDSASDSSLYMALVNKNETEAIEALKNFRSDHYLPINAEIVFFAMEEHLKSKLQEDIC